MSDFDWILVRFLLCYIAGTVTYLAFKEAGRE